MQDKKFTNRLSNETSPYLLLHAHNPVDWYPWGDEALEKARKENKLLIISIGYSACHWCHVMEEESFADTAVANLMNKYFVSIKIDREERPDIDQVYMNAVHMITRRGGWPLNIIALPNGRPIYGGTYFPKEQWMQLISRIQELYETEPQKIKDQAASITQGIQTENFMPLTNNASAIRDDDILDLVDRWMKQMDPEWGGTKGAPKFPMPAGLRFLLNYGVQTSNQDVLQVVQVTLDRMARGGIYDQIGGGFARYSVDNFWKVPHFEKMLYDNGQLASLYSFAYQQTKDPLYKSVVYETLDFVERELLSPGGGFYSSLDADSEGEEGRFYVWTETEIDELLGRNAEIIKKYYDIDKNGNWESGKNILFRTFSDEEFSQNNSLTESDLMKIIEHANTTLFEARGEKVRPSLDDKILTSWNGLMLRGFVDAYSVFGEARFLETALKNANFILDKMMKKDNRLDRNFKNGRSSINGFLDDYAILIDAFTGLYQVTFDEQWLNHAKYLLDYTLSHFKKDSSRFFNYKSDIDRELIAGILDISDNVIPSPNSIMAHNLFFLGHYFSKDKLVQMSEQMLLNIMVQAKQNGSYYANWSRLMLKYVNPFYEVAIAGDNSLEIKKEFSDHYLPNVLFSGSKSESDLPLLKNKLQEGRTIIYVCENKSCQQPVEEVEAALKQILK